MKSDRHYTLCVGIALSVLTGDMAVASTDGRCANGNDHIQVELYTRRKCEACDRARIFFLRKRLSVIERSIDELFWLHDLRSRTGQEEAPSMYACGTWVFGYESADSVRQLNGLYNVRSARISH